jgi:hypothetical protein
MMHIFQAVPVLQVSDVAFNIDWYQQRLGFQADPFPPEPPYQFAILRHWETEIMLQAADKVPNLSPQPYRWNIYLRLAGGRLRDLYDKMSAAGLVNRRLERMPYGLCEFEITAPHGYVLCLAEKLRKDRDLPTPQ